MWQRLHDQHPVGLNHDVIGIEDLQVANLLKNHNLAKAINEVSWSKFRTMLEYKAKWYGKTIIVVAKNFPSSQLCSNCGYRHKDVKDLAFVQTVQYNTIETVTQVSILKKKQ